MAALVSEYTLEFFTLLNARGKKELIEWCMKEGLIASSYECPNCNEQMRLNERKSVVLDGFEWRCRKKVCMNAVVNESVKIGGVNVIVEIDESKFGKMKYGKGKPVDGKWVFGGIERGTNRCFFRVVERRTKEELLCVIKEWVLPGNPDTGAHTNSIEGTWSAIKRFLRNHTSHAEGMFDHYLEEYLWRRSRDHSLSDETFRDFLKAVITLYPPLGKDQQ
ncbi:mitotic-spindle organizing protein 2A [Trichonephila clavipes]|uniref:Mitotic-spindle organizing protein 2A n=1 Tax=Trichonephila clavipes TaxID=2585209 RepID=A0A8X6T2G1_TRICX|nr:mitotic-spindle organizing protein 2A [Trichonephila clavipes]